MPELETVVEALRSIRISAQPEENEIHAAITEALSRAGLPYTHEARLASGCRIDFVCGSVGIEVKKGRPVASRLRAQITRYLECDALDALVVVLQKPCPLPERIGTKPVRIVALNRLWGVALP